MNIIQGRRLGPLLLTLILGSGLLSAQQTVPTPSVSYGLDPRNLDTTINPLHDFYRFANGGWLAANPVPPEFARWGSFNELTEKNFRDLKEIMESAAANRDVPNGSSAQMLGDFYASALDSAGADRLGVTPLNDEFARIARIKSVADVVAVVAHQHIVLGNPLFQFYVAQDAKEATEVIAQIRQGGLGLPDRDYYTKEDDKSKEIRKEYLAHVRKLFQLLGDDAAAAEANSKTVMALETRLATASMTLVQQRDPNATYNKMTLNELCELAPGFDWKVYFAAIGRPDPGPINVDQPVFMKEVGMMMTEVPPEQWKTYLRWQAVSAAAPWLSAGFVTESFHFNQGIITGAKEIRPRWKRALDAANTAIGEVVGIQYVRKHFSLQAMARAKAMVENLRTVFRERLKSREWMSELTKTRALAKLDAFKVKIGYPQRWKDYTGLVIDRGSVIANLMRASAYEFNRKLGEIGLPVDRTQWGLTPPTVNAYYSPTLNEIVFPAGILQPPFFDPNADDAVNYGGMGAVIGHEMTHGFDDQGSQFDAEGNLRDWWTPADKAAFTSRGEKLQNQFDEYIGIDSIHVNGKLTLGENIADLGGLSIAFAAMKRAQEGKPAVPKIDGFTQEQRFFLAWAQIWRANYTPEDIRRRLNIDVHALNKFRVNGPFVDMPEFQEAFGGKKGDPMVRAERLRAKIW